MVHFALYGLDVGISFIQFIWLVSTMWTYIVRAEWILVAGIARYCYDTQYEYVRIARSASDGNERSHA